MPEIDEIRNRFKEKGDEVTEVGNFNANTVEDTLGKVLSDLSSNMEQYKFSVFKENFQNILKN